MRSPQEEFLAYIGPYKGIISSAIRRACGATYACLYPDVEQEVYLALWQRWQDGIHLDYPTAYLYKVAVRTALAMVRATVVPDLERYMVVTHPSTAQGVTSTTLSSAECTALLTTLLDQLPSEQARALRAYLAGFTAREVAELYCWSPSVTRHRIYRGIQALRSAMGQEEPT